MAQVLEQTIDPESVPAVEATLNYIKNTGEKLFTYTGGPGSLDVRTGGTVDPHDMTIRNGRHETRDFTLDRNGFHFVPHPTKVTDFFDEGQIKRVYYPEMEALVKAESGAKRVVVFDHTLRTADDELREKTKIREVVRRVHNDYTEWSGPQRVRDLLPERGGRPSARAVCHHPGVAADPPPGRDLPARHLRRAQRLGKGLRDLRADLPRPCRSDLRGRLQSRTPLVLVSAHAARRGAGVQGVRFGKGRACALDRTYRLRGPHLTAARPPTREHRNPHPGVLLGHVPVQSNQPSLRGAPPGATKQSRFLIAIPGCFASFAMTGQSGWNSR